MKKFYLFLFFILFSTNCFSQLLVTDQQTLQPTEKQVVDGMKLRFTFLNKTLRQFYKDQFNEFWNNKYYTPEQLAAEFGTNTESLMAVFADMELLLKDIDSSFQKIEIPEGYSVVVSPNATTTIMRDTTR